MTTLRELTHPDEHMNYLLDNGYTEDAKRLFESQFTEGAAALRAGVDGGVSFHPFAWRVGFNNPGAPVDQYLWLYFRYVAQADAEAMQAEYADERDTTAGLLQF